MLLSRTQLPLQQSLSNKQVPWEGTQQRLPVQPAFESQQSLLCEHGCWSFEQQVPERLRNGMLQVPQQLVVRSQVLPKASQLPPSLSPWLVPLLVPPLEDPPVLSVEDWPPLVLPAPDELPSLVEPLPRLLPELPEPALLPLEVDPIDVAPLEVPPPDVAPMDSLPLLVLDADPP